MKKEWINPELLEENLAVTEEQLDCEFEGDAQPTCIFHSHKCPRCGYDFGHWIGSHYKWEHHVKYAKCGADVDRVPMPEVTIS